MANFAIWSLQFGPAADAQMPIAKDAIESDGQGVPERGVYAASMPPAIACWSDRNPWPGRTLKRPKGRAPDRQFQSHPIADCRLPIAELAFEIWNLQFGICESRLDVRPEPLRHSWLP